MRALRSFVHAWPARLSASVLFVLGVAALVQAATGADKSRLARDDTLSTDAGAPWRTLTPEGSVIVVTAGPFTTREIHSKLVANGVNSLLGSVLTVRVTDAYPPTRVTASGQVDDGSDATTFRATLWLDAWPGSTFSASPEWTIAHEIGHVWARYYIAAVGETGWSRYLRLRGLAGDPRVDSSYVWRREEIFAEDYRLLFGSPAAVAAGSSHLNTAIQDPRTMAGLKAFLRSIVTPG